MGFAHFVEMLKREHVATMRERGLASKLPQAFSNKPTRGRGIMFYVHICHHSALYISVRLLFIVNIDILFAHLDYIESINPDFILVML